MRVTTHYLLMFIMICLFLNITMLGQSEELYLKSKNEQTRWSSFENLNGIKGQGGKENKGAKGHPNDEIKPGETKVLLDINGSGIINRMWLTIRNRSPKMLRGLRLEMYWDYAETPAVSAPLGDFFGVGLGKKVPFESALFSDPEGRSFNCNIPMPFRKGAKVIIKNETDTKIHSLFFDINYTLKNEIEEDALYFHAYWRRENPTTLGKDFEILPSVHGKGRFLGTNIGVITTPSLKNSWWGEGEVKMYIDGDTQYPTLVGTGAEDYIGTAWGQGKFAHQYQGCLVADNDNGLWAFYRYHIPDPVFFDNDCRVTIQQMGGDDRDRIIEMLDSGAPLEVVSIYMLEEKVLHKILEYPTMPDIRDSKYKKTWMNFYREDDVSAVAYFYLDSPENGLPPLAPVEERIRGLEEKETK